MAASVSILVLLSAFPAMLFATRFTLDGAYLRAIFFMIATVGLMMLGVELWPRQVSGLPGEEHE